MFKNCSKATTFVIIVGANIVLLGFRLSVLFVVSSREPSINRSWKPFLVKLVISRALGLLSSLTKPAIALLCAIPLGEVQNSRLFWSSVGIEP